MAIARRSRAQAARDSALEIVSNPAKYPRIGHTSEDTARHVLHICSLHKDDQGQGIRVFGAACDVTERKLAEAGQNVDSGPVECEARPIAV